MRESEKLFTKLRNWKALKEATKPFTPKLVSPYAFCVLKSNDSLSGPGPPLHRHKCLLWTPPCDHDAGCGEVRACPWLEHFHGFSGLGRLKGGHGQINSSSLCPFVTTQAVSWQLPLGCAEPLLSFLRGIRGALTCLWSPSTQGTKDKLPKGRIN